MTVNLKGVAGPGCQPGVANLPLPVALGCRMHSIVAVTGTSPPSRDSSESSGVRAQANFRFR